MQRDGIVALLKGIETGDPESVAIVNEQRYVQHNPMTAEGSVGLAELFARIARTSPKVRIIRMFEDADFVFGHVEYDFGENVTGFEIFRFEDGQAVEHWDNLQLRVEGPNPSGRTMTDGPTASVDFDQTDANRHVVQRFAAEILIDRRIERLGEYVDGHHDFLEHNPERGDGIPVWEAALCAVGDDGRNRLVYDTIHRVLAEGNFVLCASEGYRDGVHSAIYDLFRIAEGVMVEHWDSIEPIAPRAQWRNDNGKF